MTHTSKAFLKDIRQLLVGKTITKITLMTLKQSEDEMAWYSRPILIHLNDGTIIYPTVDSEGNDAGCLFTNNEKLPCIPAFPL